jgi:hypothetical protein
MKNEVQGELTKYDYKNSAAFKRMENLATNLILDSQHILPVSRIFKEKAQNAMKERNQEVLGKVYQVIQNESNDRNPNLNLKYEKIKIAFEAETKLQEELQKKYENQISEFVERELELEASIVAASETLE